MKKSPVLKYLQNYAEIEAQQLSSFPQQITFQHCVVIPAFEEEITFVHQFINGQLASQNALVIIVINQPDNYHTSYLSVNNKQKQLFKALFCLGEAIKLSEQLSLVAVNNSHNYCLIVDRFSVPIPVKQGVGLARKIGCDIALQLIANKQINSNFIASTDADATLPEQYFTVQERLNRQASKYSAAYFDFHHVSSNANIHKANAQYEQALKYFFHGLRYANSAYAYFTIGSVLVLNAEKYAQVRGFPKRSAGEDFYLLNKLAKLGDFHFFSDVKIELNARISARVPFGTGPAVKNILELTAQNKPYCYYNPQVFEELKQLNQHTKKLFNYLTHVDDWLQMLSQISQQALNYIGFKQFISQYIMKQHSTSEIQFYKQWHVWFDAFKTLKFIHALREAGVADIELNMALKRANFICSNTST